MFILANSTFRSAFYVDNHVVEQEVNKKRTEAKDLKSIQGSQLKNRLATDRVDLKNVKLTPPNKIALTDEEFTTVKTFLHVFERKMQSQSAVVVSEVKEKQVTASKQAALKEAPPAANLVKTDESLIISTMKHMDVQLETSKIILVKKDRMVKYSRLSTENLKQHKRDEMYSRARKEVVESSVALGTGVTMCTAGALVGKVANSNNLKAHQEQKNITLLETVNEKMKIDHQGNLSKCKGIKFPSSSSPDARKQTTPESGISTGTVTIKPTDHGIFGSGGTFIGEKDPVTPIRFGEKDLVMIAKFDPKHNIKFRKVMNELINVQQAKDTKATDKNTTGKNPTPVTIDGGKYTLGSIRFDQLFSENKNSVNNQPGELARLRKDVAARTRSASTSTSTRTATLNAGQSQLRADTAPEASVAENTAVSPQIAGQNRPRANSAPSVVQTNANNIPVPPDLPPQNPQSGSQQEIKYKFLNLDAKTKFEKLNLVNELKGGLNAEFARFAKDTINGKGELMPDWNNALKRRAAVSQKLMQAGSVKDLFYALAGLNLTSEHMAKTHASIEENDTKQRLAVSHLRMKDILAQLGTKMDEFKNYQQGKAQLNASKQYKDLTAEHQQAIDDKINEAAKYQQQAKAVYELYKKQVDIAIKGNVENKAELIMLKHEFNSLKRPWTKSVNQAKQLIDTGPRQKIQDQIEIAKDKNFKHTQIAKTCETASSILMNVGVNLITGTIRSGTGVVMTNDVETAVTGVTEDEFIQNTLNSDVKNIGETWDQNKKEIDTQHSFIDSILASAKTSRRGTFSRL